MKLFEWTDSDGDNTTVTRVDEGVLFFASSGGAFVPVSEFPRLIEALRAVEAAVKDGRPEWPAVLNGARINLDDYSWVLWGTCGCALGLTAAVCGDGAAVYATPEQALKSFCDEGETVPDLIGQGFHVELLPASDAAVVTFRCPHRAYRDEEAGDE